jgi:hypothetical protein
MLASHFWKTFQVPLHDPVILLTSLVSLVRRQRLLPMPAAVPNATAKVKS